MQKDGEKPPVVRVSERSAPEPAPAPREDVRVAALSRCPYCHADAGVAASRGVCAACLARHHEACWAETGRCASCGHTVRLELPSPPQASRLAPLLAVMSGILLLLLGGALAGLSDARDRVTAIRRDRQEVEASLVAERASAGATARAHADELLVARFQVREAQAQAAQALDAAAKANVRAKALEEQLASAAGALNEAEQRAYAAELRAGRLEARLTELEGRVSGRPQTRAWSRAATRLEAQGRLRLALARPIDAFERVRLDLAASALEPKRDGELARLLTSPPELLLFAAADHPELGQRSARALEQLRDAQEPLRCAYAGHVKLVRGDLDGAMTQVHRALDEDPTCGLAWIVRAQVRLARRDVEGALGDVVVGEALDDVWTTWSLFTRAKIHAAAGRPCSAIQDLETLQALGTSEGLGLDGAVKALLQQQRALLTRPR